MKIAINKRILYGRLFVLISALVSASVIAAIRDVPAEYATIQLAVNASGSGDTVLIAPGQYSESVILPDRDVTVGSRFILSRDTNDIFTTSVYSGDNGYTFLTQGGDNLRSLVLAGIRFARTTNAGGGLRCAMRDLVVNHCVFDSCVSGGGPVLDVADGSADIRFTSFLNCTANSSLLRFENCAAIFSSSVFLGNRITPELLTLYGSLVSLSKCILRENGLHSRGNLCRVATSSELILDSCVLVSNDFKSLLLVSPQGSTIQFSCTNTVIDSNAIAFNLLDINGWYDGSNIVFSGNYVANTSTIQGFGGSYLLALGSVNFVLGEVLRNVFYKNHRRQTPGILYAEFGQYLVSRNYFIENTTEGFLSSPGGSVMLIGNNLETFHENVLIGNQGNAVDHFGLDGPGHAEHNYWGHFSGPYNEWSNPEGLGDTVDTLIFYEPWESDTLFLATVEDLTRPVTFALGYPYPNPFNSTITIEYALTREQEVKLEIFDVLGRNVETILNDRQSAGVHSILWNADNQPSGVYFAKLSSPQSNSQTVKLLLLK